MENDAPLCHDNHSRLVLPAFIMVDLYNVSIYNRLLTDVKMPNCARYLKKNKSIDLASLTNQLAIWAKAGIRLPEALAPWTIGKDNFCTFWNHPRGAGCSRQQANDKVRPLQFIPRIQSISCPIQRQLTLIFPSCMQFSMI